MSNYAILCASAVIVSASVLMVACGDDSPPKTAAVPVVELTPELKQGQAIWNDTCAVCHKVGLAGAPKIGDKAAWQPRIAQGLDTLFEHALHGFLGKAGTEMPARGGNANLSDDEVKLAVRYMVSQSQ